MKRPVIVAAVACALLAVLAVAALTGEERRPAAARTPAASPTASPGPATSPGPTGSPPPTMPGPRPPEIDDALMRGQASAPVTIVEFGDYQCTDCGRFSREIEPVLRREYVETGQVRIAWRDFPIYGERSVRAAVAARAAARQGRFWQYHDALYAGQKQRDGKLDDGHLRAAARRTGLDMREFEQALADRALRDKVMADFAFGQQLGVPGTPGFLINGRPFFGAQPLDAFREAIERARSES